MMKITAAVVHEAKAPFELQTVELGPPHEDEVLVRIVASGVCHTDVVCRDHWIPVPLPVVLGHEGSGVVEQVGSAVRDLAVGDHVVLSWGRGCGRCNNCLRGEQAYCDQMGRVSFSCQRADGSTSITREGQRIHSHFIGQSSFATHAVVQEAHAVKVDRELPLELLGPLGCGLLTGSGAVFDALRVPTGSTLIVFGVGAVGLSAVMAAKVVGCSRIVAIDLNRERLTLARELGASDALHPEDGPLGPRIQELLPGGADFAIETTANPDVVRSAVEAVHLRGVCALLGAAPLGTELKLDMFSVLLGRTIKGVIVGDGVPQRAIPRLIELYKSGRFPLESLVRFYDFSELNQAVEDSLLGRVVKPVVCMR
jgi:aryl-alcohol dehydrogenase